VTATQPWTGETACALQKALRLSNERFAEQLGIGVRTVAGWHQKPTLKPKSEMQQLLDVTYERASASVRARFAALVGDAVSTQAEPTVDDQARADAELRLSADAHISAALEWLDGYANWSIGTGRQRVAERMSTLDVRQLRDRGARRGNVTQARVTRALLDYYGAPASGYGTYAATCGTGSAVTTTILTKPDWLDLTCPLMSPLDGLTLGEASPPPTMPTDQHAIDASIQRLAETLELGTRLVNMPLYWLRGIDVDKPHIGGDLGVVPFVQYALTMDLLEGELLDALAATDDISGQLPLRDYYLPNLDAVARLGNRLCAGGVLALCAIARPAGLHGEADYLLLIQQRSGNVLNANRQLAVIPKGFHQPSADYRADTRLGATLLREMEEELFGREDVDSTIGKQRSADPMHPGRLSAPMRWLLDRPLGERLRLECVGFGLNLVSGNYEFPSLIVMDDEDFWTEYGGQIEANWESSTMRRYSSRDTEGLTRLAADVAWSNEGLFALLQGLRRLAKLGGHRVKLPVIEWELQ
jgi:hypothetical protein